MNLKGFNIVPLNILLEQVGEERSKNILSSFSCELNRDVEKFLHNKAIIFEKQGIAKTNLVFASFKNEIVMVGYFSLANKMLLISNKHNLSSNLRKRINKFAINDNKGNSYHIVAPLIAQLGKNYQNNYNKLITGDELLQMAIDRVQEGMKIFGGKVVYLECENKPKLIQFYENNGFKIFNQRPLDKDEKDDLYGDNLLQLLRYL